MPKPPGERTRQNRIPGEDWGAFSTKQRASQTKAAGQTNPIGGPQQPTAGGNPKATGPSFALKGKGKYYNPSNVNGQQFNKPAIHGAILKGLDTMTWAGYFRHAGMGQALRHTLGVPLLSSHTNDSMNAKYNRETRSTQGIDPGSVSASRFARNPGDFEGEAQA